MSASNIAAALAPSAWVSSADDRPAASKQPLRIFLVDDSDDDIAMFRHLLVRALPKFPCHLAHADAMAPALEQLQQEIEQHLCPFEETMTLLMSIPGIAALAAAAAAASDGAAS